MNRSDDFPTFDLHCVAIMSSFARIAEDPEVVNDVVEALRKLKLEHYALEDKIRVIEKRANIDVKTGLYRYNDLYLENVLKIASRALEGKGRKDVYQVAYVRFDLDDFSRLNNMYGHDLGDRVLEAFAQMLREISRPTDWAIRYGGEEFDLLLPSTDSTGAMNLVEKIMARLRKFRITHERTKVQITASAGITELSVPVAQLAEVTHKAAIKTYHQIQKQADDALYHSKALGKNQAQIYDAAHKAQYTKYRREYALRTHRG